MIDLKRVRAVALDIAGARGSYERQEEFSEFIWLAIQRHYRIFLYTTEAVETLAGEDFVHRRVVFLRDAMPPAAALLKAHPELTEPSTLWITDDAALQAWLHGAGLAFMHLQHGTTAPPGGQHLPRLSELSALLDPTALLLRDVTRMVDDLRRFRPRGALVVSVGGPPLSGYQTFALRLRSQLQDSGHDLVELMDVTSLMQPSEALLKADVDKAIPWVSPEAERWLREAVLAPLRAGSAVYVETPPPALPAGFSAHFPLYISEASVLLLFGEQVFAVDVEEAMGLAILLEVSAEETTRRLFEIDEEDGRIDPKFTAQYRSREGRVYEEYLLRNRARERASLRVNANDAEAFRPIDTEPPALV